MTLNFQRPLVFTVLTLAACCALPVSSAMAADTQLVYHDFREAMQVARERQLPLLLHFGAEWCNPCQRMEQTVFARPELERNLAGKLILVKIDADRSPELTQMYRVNSYPSDVFIDTQGRVLSKSSGVSSLQGYIASALQVESRYRQSTQLVQERQESGNSPAPYSFLDIRLGQTGPFPESVQVSQTRTDSKPAPTETLTDVEEKEPEVVFVALDGYCPVRLREKRSWVKGAEKHSFIYQQQEYRCAGADEVKAFESNPDDYAPRLLGCDPVLMWETDRALPGSTEFAAYYGNQLYLFTSEENREMFRIDPQRYIDLKHVLAPRDVEATLIR
ncbi:MAG: thioredoxin family protein [Rubinisphaera brasiliensis]|uniref:YHS domain-containing protein n=1 Tax=Rubinisphaera brasiliensis (strain ATCC 49424 / DSM 5305 / JCM 21570 / IAM 15109 / NBRC 103401 / IFAM 1448) TaxID=756272 RepID=F0SFY5_RUBBR|nr:thioredoxin family protein [Rubinisphaera brasiliensis]ADY58274.1 YHS domain-containing protein [Rubinisphaera brasiliensis DSM 5305]MBR9800953.1 DUF255 domain-containing protein [bacterium]